MSASTDPDRRARGAGDGWWQWIAAAAWRPAGLGYLAVCLAALLVGLYPQAVYPSRSDVTAAPLPTLHALATAQALFILLVHPLVLLRRFERGFGRRYWAETVAESLTWLIATAPFYVAAAWLGDATPADVARTAVFLLCLWPVAWSAGALLRTRPAARPAVVLGLLVIAALPGAYYIAREFLRVYAADWLWDLAPATFAWQVATARAGSAVPRPLWALLAWPALAAGLASLSAPHRPNSAATASTGA